MTERYEAASEAARNLLNGFDDIDLAEMVAARDRADVQRQQQIVQREAERDGAYRERAHLVAWLAALHPAVIAPASDVDEDGWQILYLTAGTWQMSWHIAPRDAELFAGVEHVDADDPRAQWDGHTTEQKYDRIRHHADAVRTAPPFARAFRLHHHGRVLQGAEFPGGQTVLLDLPDAYFMTGAPSLDQLLLGYPHARIEWASASMCGQSVPGLIGAMPLGPCVPRHQHDDAVHQDTNGTTWSRNAPADDTEAQRVGTVAASHEAAPGTEQVARAVRRDSLRVLLTRVEHGLVLSEDEARTLRWHVKAEMDEADAARRSAETARDTTLREAIETAQAEAIRLEEMAGIEPARGARCVSYLLNKRLRKQSAQPHADGRSTVRGAGQFACTTPCVRGVCGSSWTDQRCGTCCECNLTCDGPPDSNTLSSGRTNTPVRTDTHPGEQR
ncbi:hypothetical protein AB0P17_15415 [Streptomyces sp. NPDC088124]|uniref:hypothetical protein n=1 Tax=Streptomyces sp. NPDC088124 TaxID=3154654 RepID=UPI003428A66F